MSCGVLICSVCHREVHQDSVLNGDRLWRHCDDDSIMCSGSQAVYAGSPENIQGEWCGRDRCLDDRRFDRKLLGKGGDRIIMDDPPDQSRSARRRRLFGRS